jgi:tetratricopeptide (TPR) repeat protein
MENGRKVLGVLLLIGGIVIALFGIMYMNSPQYKTMSMVNSVTGSHQDSTGVVAIGIGAVLSVIGLIALVAGGSSATNNATPKRATSAEARRLFDSGERQIKIKDYDGALEILERVLDIQPFAPMTNYYLGTLYSVKEDKNRAFKHLSLAIEQGFKDFRAMDSTPRLDFLRKQPEYREFVRNGYKLPEVKSADDGDYIAKLERLGKLKTEGLITDEEFTEQKSKLLNSQSL